MDDAARLTSQGFPLLTQLSAPPGTPFATYLDFDGGPRDVLGERLLLGLTTSLFLWDGGIVDPTGYASRFVQVPLFAGALGLVVYGQALLVDVTAPNGVFRATNAASTATYVGSGALVASFNFPILEGYTGNFAADVEGHIRGGPVTQRTVETINPGSGLVNAGIQAPLTPFGCRGQYVFKSTELAATGERELVTAVRWLPYQAPTVIDDTFPSFDFRIGHTDVAPNYSVDPFSALPVAPNSGLSPTFAANERPGEAPVVVYQGPYAVSAADLRPNGYLPYPMFTPFEYDGVSSLLLDFRVGPGLAQGLNGQTVYIQVQSDPLPGARVVRFGTSMNPILPGQATTGTPDNAMPALEIEFTRAVTTALSPWYWGGANTPDYGTPVLAQSLPFGTAIHVRYRGTNTLGTAPTAWSSTPDVADGMSFLQFEITFEANPQTGERPVLDTLIVPTL